MSFAEVVDMILNTVKIDKLCFGLDKITPEIKDKVIEIVKQYYNIFATSNNIRIDQLYCEVTPTKQLRANYNGYNHNLQMIPLDQFYRFLQALVNAVGEDIAPRC